MKSKIKKSNGTARHMEIVLPTDRVDKVLKEVLQEIRKEADIAGFRRGKAPEDLVLSNYREKIMDETKRRLVPQAYQDALAAHKVTPVSLPELSDVVMDPKGELSFTAKVDARPEIKLKRYKGIKAERRKITVTDDEVEEALSRVRNMHAEFIGTDGPIRKGDYGICDVEAFIDGKLISKKREKAWIEANRENSMLGLGEELCGMNAGEKKTIDVTLPEGYPDKKYAGKKAEFTVEVKEIREKKLPEMDDELAKKAGKETIAQLREELRTQIMERKELNDKIKMKNRIMEFLLKKHDFDLPESMVNRQFDVLMKRAKDELVKKGVDEKAIESHTGKLNEQLMKEARNKVRIYFILDEIADQEGISVTDEEVDAWLESMSGYYNQEFDDVKKYYEEHDLLGGVEEQLREDKTLDFLLSEAAVSVKKN